jgi:hypothetical protein
MEDFRQHLAEDGIRHWCSLNLPILNSPWPFLNLADYQLADVQLLMSLK